MGVVWTFLLSSILSILPPSLWETARYRLKYCLKGPLNPKQPTNQPLIQKRQNPYKTYCGSIICHRADTGISVSDLNLTIIVGERSNSMMQCVSCHRIKRGEIRYTGENDHAKTRIVDFSRENWLMSWG